VDGVYLVLEHLSTVFETHKHIEAGTRRSQQYNVALLGGLNERATASFMSEARSNGTNSPNSAVRPATNPRLSLSALKLPWSISQSASDP
jgi:hypothetical protein